MPVKAITTFLPMDELINHINDLKFKLLTVRIIEFHIQYLFFKVTAISHSDAPYYIIGKGVL